MTGSRLACGVAGMAFIGSLLCGCANTQQAAVPCSEPLPLPVIFAMQQTQPATLPSRVYNWNEIAVQTTTSGQRRAFFDTPTAPGEPTKPPPRNDQPQMGHR